MLNGWLLISLVHLAHIGWNTWNGEEGGSDIYKVLFYILFLSIRVCLCYVFLWYVGSTLHPFALYLASGNNKPHNKSLSGMEKSIHPGVLPPHAAGGSLSSLPISESEDEMPGT